MSDHTVLSLVMQAGPFVKAVLMALLMFSVFSWAVIIYKANCFRRAAKESEAFLRAYEQSPDGKATVAAAKGMRQSPLAALYLAAHGEGRSREELRRLLRRHEAAEAGRLQAYLTFLGTTGSTAPFIGLLGTVWGIMNAFRGIGASGSASLAVVAPGIAEALITTAAGLAAAIPAVMAYNYFVSRARRMAGEIEDFTGDLLEAAGGRR
jgi:biopolymer transport protein TolQ